MTGFIHLLKLRYNYFLKYMTLKSQDINYSKALFPKSYEKNIYDEMVENGEIGFTCPFCGGKKTS